MLSASPGSEYVMSVCDCEDGKRLLKAAAQPNSASVERYTFSGTRQTMPCVQGWWNTGLYRLRTPGNDCDEA
jgi:hypothetical protein